MPLFNEVADRLENSTACYVALATLFAEYHSACAEFNWTRAEKIRGVLIETMEASLDATAAIFMALENGKA